MPTSFPAYAIILIKWRSSLPDPPLTPPGPAHRWPSRGCSTPAPPPATPPPLMTPHPCSGKIHCGRGAWRSTSASASSNRCSALPWRPPAAAPKPSITCCCTAPRGWAKPPWPGARRGARGALPHHQRAGPGAPPRHRGAVGEPAAAGAAVHR